MSDLVGNPEDRFSGVAAHVSLMISRYLKTGSYFLKSTIKLIASLTTLIWVAIRIAF